jgi:hypothetical protein
LYLRPVDSTNPTAPSTQRHPFHDFSRYAHYAGGRREPDLETLVVIARSLSTTPNWLLGVDADGKKATKRSSLLDRLGAAAREMGDEELRITTVQAEAVARSR